jgi:hypothetical protein
LNKDYIIQDYLSSMKYFTMSVLNSNQSLKHTILDTLDTSYKFKISINHDKDFELNFDWLIFLRLEYVFEYCGHLYYKVD